MPTDVLFLRKDWPLQSAPEAKTTLRNRLHCPFSALASGFIYLALCVQCHALQSLRITEPEKSLQAGTLPPNHPACGAAAPAPGVGGRGGEE